MGKLFRGAICCVALFFVCSITRGDAIDNFAKALKQLAAPKQEKVGKLGGEDEGYGLGGKKKDSFYKLTVDERLEDLDRRWDKFDNLSKEEQALLRKQTYETILLTISGFLRDGLGTIRGAIELVAPQLAFAKAPVENFADFVFLLGYLTSKICDPTYRENLEKLRWISTCMAKNAQSRETFVDKASGENKCKIYGCVESKKCLAVFFQYAINAFEPWVEVSVKGIDADGRHIEGMLSTIIKVAVPGQDQNSLKIVKDFEKFSRLLTLTIKLMKTTQASLKMGR